MSSGCQFAAQFSHESSRRIAFATVLNVDATTPADVTRHFEEAALRDHAAAVVFPGIRHEADLHALIDALARDARWRSHEVASMRPERLAIALHWKTRSGHWSRTMGLAPLLTMPITRRAPYVAIAAWPGSARKPDVDAVGFGDMPSGLGDRHKPTLSRTRALTREMLADDPDRDVLGEIAFCLNRTP